MTAEPIKPRTLGNVAEFLGQLDTIANQYGVHIDAAAEIELVDAEGNRLGWVESMPWHEGDPSGRRVYVYVREIPN